MKVNERTVYHCSYCSEYYLHKHHGERHEKFCRHNPNNKHQCFVFCKHLVKDAIDVGFTEYSSQKYTVFECACNKQQMYSYKAEKTLLRRFPEQFEEAIRMPLVCESYQPKDGYVPDDILEQIKNGRNPDPITL